MKITTLIATCFLLLGMQAVQAEDAIFTSDSQNKAGKISNCDFDSTMFNSQGAIDLSSIELKMTVCNEDFAYNPFIDLKGNTGVGDSLIGINAAEERMGFTKKVQGSLTYEQIRQVGLTMMLLVFSVCLLPALGFWIFSLANPENDFVKEHVHRPYLLLGALLIATTFGLITRFLILYGIGAANLLGLAYLLDTMSLINLDSENLTSVDSARMNADATQILAMATSREQTRMSIFSHAYRAVTNNDAAFWSLDKNYTAKELAEEINEYSKFEVDKTRYYTIGADMTEAASDVFNPNVLVSSYDFIKASPFLDNAKKVFGYETVLGSVDVGSNGTKFEDATGESINDGNLINQLDNVRSAAVKEFNGTEKFLSDVDATFNLILPHMKTNADFYTDDYSRNTFLTDSNEIVRKGMTATASTIIDSKMKLDVIKFKNSASQPIALAYAYSNIFAAALGHTKRGDDIMNVINAVSDKIYVAKKNEYCTRKWADNDASRRFVKAFNSLPDGKSLYQISRMPEFSDVRVSPGANCFWLNPVTNKLQDYGSSKMSDINEYRMIQVAYRAAIEITMQNYFVGLKRAIASQKKLYNEQIAEMLNLSKLGFIGSVGLSSSQMSKFKSNEQLKNSQISNALHWSYRAANGKATNYVILEAVNETVTTDNIQQLERDSFVEFPPEAVDFTNLNVLGIMNVSPSRLDDKALLSGANIQSMLYKFIALEPASVKAYLGLDPDLSMMEGAASCIQKPLVCDARPKPTLLQAVIQMGMDWIDWAVAVMAAKGISGAAVAASDSLPEVISKVTGFVGEDGKKGQIGQMFKVAVNMAGKILLITIQTIDVVLGLMMPLATIMLVTGIFVAYVIPTLIVLIFVMMVLMLIFNLAGKECLLVPIKCLMLPFRSKQEYPKQLMEIANNSIALGAALPFGVFFGFLSLQVINTVNLSKPAIYMIAAGSGTFIGGIVVMILVFVLLVSTVLMALNKIIPNTNAAMEAAFTQSPNHKDEMIKDILRSLQSPTAIQSAQLIASNIDQMKNTTIKNISKSKQRELRNRFNNPGSQQTQGSN